VQETETKRGPTNSVRGRWKLKEVRTRFIEIVRLANNEGAQRIGVCGRNVIAVLAIGNLRKLVPTKPADSLLNFLEGLKLDGLDIIREPDRGRDVEL